MPYHLWSRIYISCALNSSARFLDSFICLFIDRHTKYKPSDYCTKFACYRLIILLVVAFYKSLFFPLLKICVFSLFVRIVVVVVSNVLRRTPSSFQISYAHIRTYALRNTVSLSIRILNRKYVYECDASYIQAELWMYELVCVCVNGTPIAVFLHRLTVNALHTFRSSRSTKWP